MVHLNLYLRYLSQEYFKAVDTTQLIAPIFTMAFRDSSTVYVKKARGAMVRYIVQRRVVTPADLQGFTGDPRACIPPSSIHSLTKLCL